MVEQNKNEIPSTYIEDKGKALFVARAEKEYRDSASLTRKLARRDLSRVEEHARTSPQRPNEYATVQQFQTDQERALENFDKAEQFDQKASRLGDLALEHYDRIAIEQEERQPREPGQ